MCICTDNYPEQCKWEGPIRSRYISGNDQKTLTGLTAAECKEACEAEGLFNCLSFDYRLDNNYCYLSRANRYSVALSTSTTYDYYERNCRGKHAMFLDGFKNMFFFNFKACIPEQAPPLFI